MKRTWLVPTTALLTLSILFTGCSSNSTNNSSAKESATPNNTKTLEESKAPEAVKKVKVRLSYWNKEDSVKALLQLFKDKLPDIDVEYQFIDNKTYVDVIKTQLAAGEGPDIIGGVIDANTVKTGYFEDLTERYASKYYETGTSTATFDNKLYGLPQASWFNGVYYNVDLFAKYDLKVPTTLDEYFQVAEVLKKNGIKPQAIGLKNPNVAGQSFLGLALNEFIGTTEGKKWNDDFGKGNSKMVDALEPALTTWTEYLKRGVFTKDMLGLEEEQAIDEFTSGKAAMFQAGPWYMETFKQKAPDMKIDMFPNLGTKGGPGWMVGGPGVSFGLNAKSKVKDAAYKVLDLLSTPEGQNAYWVDNKGGSSFLKGVTFEMPAEYNGAQEAFKAGNVMYPVNNWGVAGPAFSDLGKGIQEIIAGTKTPRQVLEAVDKKAVELLEKSK
ncbi:ABC transporter substrate-binding protein [Paenibacillus nitricinens]|uniref:ABC transporter substrate-binding protein n=1 Tax=Paenibacillus nitricinens TaxID=3367691 RepID=UPI003F83AAC5